MAGREYLSLLDLSPYRLLNPSRAHFVLWAYFDGSRDDLKGYITLAGIVSSEAIWPEFEKAWMSVLEKYDIHEFHMTDAMAKPPRGQFAGWSEESINKIVKEFINAIAKFASKSGFLMKACTVKLEDYFKVKSENPYLRRPEAICVNFCCGTGLPPDPSNPAEFKDVIFYFDHNEKFIWHIKSVWEKAKKHQGWPSQIKDILPITATNVPALQAVDCMAWAANGAHKGDDRAKWMFFMFPLTGGIYQLYDYEKIKERYGNDTPKTDPYAYKARRPSTKV